MKDATAHAKATSVFGVCASPGDVHLRVLATSDLHMQIWPHDYFHDTAQPHGLAVAAGHIAQLASQADNTLIVDNGDFLQGTPMGDLFAEEPQRLNDAPHPMIAALNALGIDAATLGNHEFNYGLPFLQKTLAGADFPVVCANLCTTLGATASDDERLIQPSVILSRSVTTLGGKTHTLDIGITGFAPPQTTLWDRKYLENKLVSRDILEAAQAEVPRLRRKGADVVLALSHSGIGDDEPVKNMENASIPLAAIDGIDALIAGHTHLVFPSDMHAETSAVDPVAGRLHGKPTVMPGVGGTHIGVIDMLLSPEKAGWSVKASRSRAHAVDAPATETDQTKAILSCTRDAHKATLAYIRRPVAQSDVPLHSYFSAIEPCASVRLINAAQLWKTRALLKGGPYETLPLLSAASPFKCGGRGGPDNFTDVPPGGIQYKHLSDMYLYPNQLRALLITGRDLRNWLDHVAGYYNQIVPDRAEQALLNPAYPGHDADTILGVSYSFDLTQPARYRPDGTLANAAASRVAQLCHDGRDVTDTMRFIVAVNDYRASADGSFPGAHDGRTVLAHPERNREILGAYLKHVGTVKSLPNRNWGIMPVRNAEVTFETGPGAARQAHDIARLGLRFDKQAGNGFLRYQMQL